MSPHDKEQTNEQEHEPEQIELPSHEELLKKLNEAELKANQYWDRLLRMQAESDNTQRRAERDVANAHKYALEKFVMELLPIIDSLERSLAIAEEKGKNALPSLIEGVQLTLKMFQGTLEKFGVKQVNPESQAFNPEYHQAVSMQADADVAPGTVINVLQKGYLLNERLIRPALVVVANK